MSGQELNVWNKHLILNKAKTPRVFGPRSLIQVNNHTDLWETTFSIILQLATGEVGGVRLSAIGSNLMNLWSLTLSAWYADSGLLS